MEKATYRKYLLILAFVGLLLDQATKYGVFAQIPPGKPEYRSVVISDVFELVAQNDREKGEGVPHVNQGALFGFLSKWEHKANTIFAIISFFAAIAIVLWSFPRSTAEDRGLCVALGLILGGTLGNLYDRVFFGGVRDFLYWHYKNDFNWPVFNVADCCLVVGAGFLLLQAFRAQPNPEKKSDEEETPTLRESRSNVEALSGTR